MRFLWILFVLSFLFLVGAAMFNLRNDREYLPDPVPLVAPEVEYQVYEGLQGKG